MIHCQPARDYVKSQRSLKAAWDNCVNPHWLWWILDDLVTLRVLDCSVRELLNDVQNKETRYPEACVAIREAISYKLILDAFKQHLRNNTNV